ncbi:uncharacterized protein I206_101438 [Kwoniella pini CBS 10737]|uniref:GID complex catalytic subunit 2 n=1 Tax=Kwoniella pini CBS 10737 TaxID=1296096 RepID=A0A1B9HWN0_9TREE|nr:uncharacterized protein I206_06591 [Kwoniella pini CBS 10737]OCF47685.1 hypothetical protein I206_06591 [Kwoniella pini CBS 10737]
MDISQALSALEALSSSTSTSSSGPLNALIDIHFNNAKSRILAGEDPKVVITELQKNVKTCKKDVEKGLKAWYGALGNVGKEVDRAFPPNLGAISEALSDPPLFSSPEASQALDGVILESLGRRGIWEAVEAMEEETSQSYSRSKRDLSSELQYIIESIKSSNLQPALQWCETNSRFLSSPPHPSSLPYHLHETVFKSINNQQDAIKYARSNMMGYVPSQPVLKLITSCLYDSSNSISSSTNGFGMNGSGMKGKLMNGKIIEDLNEAKEREKLEKLNELQKMFQSEFCRLHQWSKEDSLEVTVELGSRGGTLDKIEKARRVMGEHLGNVRKWEELPMEVPLPPSRRYHSVFVCPVSKEQATESNPPKMLTCGHVIAEESFNRLLKGGRRSVKCPYCPMETSQSVAQRLYF